MLGRGWGFAYRGRVIGFLRFVGILNAAVWFGAAVFFTLGAGPATLSEQMKDLLGPKNYPYYSVAVGQIIAARYFHLELACSVVAVLHVTAEWLYLGKVPQKVWRGLLVGLVAANLVGGVWLQPRLKALHHIRYSMAAQPERRQAANSSFRTWQSVNDVFNVALVGGLALYLWRVANPSDPARFVSAVKFRS